MAGLANALAAARPPLILCAANSSSQMYTKVATSGWRVKMLNAHRVDLLKVCAALGPVVLKSTSSHEQLNGANGRCHERGIMNMNGTIGTAYHSNGRAKTLRVGIVLSGGQAPGVHVALYL